MKKEDVKHTQLTDDLKQLTFEIEGQEVKVTVKGEHSVVSLNDDTPSIEFKNLKVWTNDDGVAHRLSGPAVIDTDDDVVKYYINGTAFSKEEFFQQPEVMNHRKRLINLDED